MASIYKRDKRRRGAPYWIQFKDHQGKRRTVRGFTDKALTEQLAGKLEHEVLLIKRGLLNPHQAKHLMGTQGPLSDHLEVFERSLTDNTPKYIRLTMSRVRRIVDGCGFAAINELDGEAVQEFLRTLAEEEDLGHRTYNHYLQAMDAFCNWCVRTGRMMHNPLSQLERRNTEVDVRHQRRALRPNEFAALIASARSSDLPIQRYSGEERAQVYLVSYMTGLRKGELASLTPRSFDLDANPPTVTIEAKHSKHRKKDVLPLHPKLVEMLRPWLASFDAGEKLFPGLAGKKTWLMVRKDLERAGIPYETEEGIADFHAAGRHTHITELLRNGASLPEAQRLARHSDIKMTMRYTHIGIEDQAKALAALPAPDDMAKDQQPAGGKSAADPPEPASSSKEADSSALQMRCISRGVSRLSESSAVTDEVDPKRQNPCRSKGFDNVRRQASFPDKVEAAGIEPASRDISTRASTCVVD